MDMWVFVVYGWCPVPGWNKVRLPDGIGASTRLWSSHVSIIMRTHLLAPALLFPILRKEYCIDSIDRWVGTVIDEDWESNAHRDRGTRCSASRCGVFRCLRSRKAIRNGRNRHIAHCVGTADMHKTRGITCYVVTHARLSPDGGTIWYGLLSVKRNAGCQV